MKPTYTGATIRQIAMGTMLLDHIAVCLLEYAPFQETAAGNWLYMILRFIGRMAFPLYCFLLMEAFKHTRNRFRYLLTLLVMAVVTEPIFDLAVYDTWNWKHQNVLFTFSMGFLLIWVLEEIRKIAESAYQYPAKIRILLLGYILFTTGAGFFSLKLGFDYPVVGILYLVILSLMPENRDGTTCAGIILFSAESGFGALASFYLIHRYRGELGELKVPHWFYRTFYPFHLFVLLVIRKLLIKI